MKKEKTKSQENPSTNPFAVLANHPLMVKDPEVLKMLGTSIYLDPSKEE